MAYYNSSYYQTGHDDHSEYYLTSYAHNSDDSAPVSYSSYEDPTFQSLLEYQYPNPTPYYHANYHSASTYSHPISIQYDLKFYEQSYDTGVTQFLLSYSVSPEFNEPEIDDYDEYDSTPYDGGFDIALTYGKPLPPSNETCYPRVGSSSPPDLKPTNLNGAIVPVNVGGNEAVADEQAAKPNKEISLSVQLVKEEEQQEKSEEQAIEKGSQVLALENGDDTKSQGKTNQGDDQVYNSGYGSGRGLYDQVPSGYGLEAMDICESLFGYWPCLARDLKISNCEPENGQRSYNGSYKNPWKGSADYLFGSSNPYGEERRGYYDYEDYRG